MELDKAIKQRHSCRKFKDKKPDWRNILDALDSSTKSPLAGNIQTLKFILVSEPEKIKKIMDACQQHFVGSVHYIIAFCTDNEQIKRSYGERGERYSRQQAGASIQNFLLTLTEIGLATCWVGAYSDRLIKKALEIPENIEVDAIFPIGFEVGKGKQKYKKELDKLIFFNKWGEKHMKPIKKVEAF